MSRPDWLKPGAEVAVLTSGPHTESVTYSTIDRVLKRDVVLADGQRFNADSRSRNRGTWSGNDYLLPRDDKRIREAEERIRFVQSKSRLRGLLQDADLKVNYARTMDDIRGAVAELRDALGGDS